MKLLLSQIKVRSFGLGMLGIALGLFLFFGYFSQQTSATTIFCQPFSSQYCDTENNTCRNVPSSQCTGPNPRCRSMSDYYCGGGLFCPDEECEPGVLPPPPPPNPPPPPSATPPNVSLNLNLNPSSGLAPNSISLSWNDVGGTAPVTCTSSGSWSGSRSPSGGSTTFSNQPAGFYSYTLACAGPGGTDSDTKTANITAPPPPNPPPPPPAPPVDCNVSPSTASINQNISLSATGGTGSYSWSAPGGSLSSSSGSSTSVSYSTSGSKTISVSSGSQNGSCSVYINPPPLPPPPPPPGPPPPPPPAAPNVSVFVNGSSSSTRPSPGSGVVSYSISNMGSSPCQAYDAWSGSKYQGGPSENKGPYPGPSSPPHYKFTLVCVNAGGTASDTAVLEISAPLPPPPPNPPPPPLLSCNAFPSTVNIGQNVSLSASGGTGSYTWSAPGGSLSSSSGSNSSVSYSTSGSKSITLTSGAQNDTCSVYVNAPTPPPPPPNPPPPPLLSCNANPSNANIGQQINLSATGGTGSYSWSAPGGSLASSSGSSTSVTFSTSGSKSITLTSGAQTDSCPVFINAPAPPPPPPNPPPPSSVSCSANPSSANIGQTINLSASGGTGVYSWSAPGGNLTSSSGSSSQVSYSTSGSKSIIVTSGSLTSSCPVFINAPTPPPPPAPQPSVSVNVNGSSYSVRPSPGSGTISYSISNMGSLPCQAYDAWSGNKYQGGPSENKGPFVGPSSPPHYKYTLVCTNGGAPVSDTAVLEISAPLAPPPPNPPPPTLPPPPPPAPTLSCSGPSSAVQNQNITFSAIGGQSPFSWLKDNAPTGTTSSSFTTSFATTGNHTARVSDSSGQQATCNISITATPPPPPVAPPLVIGTFTGTTPVNDGTRSTLTWQTSGGTPPVTCRSNGGAWTLNNGGSSGSTQTNTLLNASSPYTFTILCSDSNGQTTRTTQVSVLPPLAPPPPTLPPPPPPANPIVQLTATSIFGTAPFSTTLMWRLTGGTPTYCNATSQPVGVWTGSKNINGGNQTLNGLGVGTYIFTITCGNGGVPSSDSIVVSVVSATTPPPPPGPTPPPPVAPPPPAPSTTSVNLTVSSGTVPVGSTVTITWNSSNTSSCVSSGVNSFPTGGRTNSTSPIVSSPLNTPSPPSATFTLICFENGTGDPYTDTEQVTVSNSPPPPNPPPPALPPPPPTTPPNLSQSNLDIVRINEKDAPYSSTTNNDANLGAIVPINDKDEVKIRLNIYNTGGTPLTDPVVVRVTLTNLSAPPSGWSIQTPDCSSSCSVGPVTESNVGTNKQIEFTVNPITPGLGSDAVWGLEINTVTTAPPDKPGAYRFQADAWLNPPDTTLKCPSDPGIDCDLRTPAVLVFRGSEAPNIKERE